MVRVPYIADQRLTVPPKLTKAALGYLAGIMDGEGCFAASPKSNSFGLRVSMTDHSVIAWLGETFGGVVQGYEQVLPSGKVMRTWLLHRQADIAHLLPLLMPYLICKRAQATAMLTLVSHMLAKPVYDTPTRKVGVKERDRRRMMKEVWTKRMLELRAAVPAARFE